MRLATSLVLRYVVVGVLPPVDADVGCTIPVLCAKGHTGAFVSLEQRTVYKICGVGNTLGQSPRHLSVVHAVQYPLGIIFALLSAVAAYLVDEPHLRKLPVALVVDAVSNGTARFAHDDVLLPHATVVDERFEQSQRNERRRVEVDCVVMGHGVVHVELYGNGLPGLVATLALTVTLVEVGEKSLPRFLCRLLSCHGLNGLAHHTVGLVLRVPSVFNPQPGFAVPRGHARTVNPRYTAGLHADAFAHRLVYSRHQWWSFLRIGCNGA